MFGWILAAILAPIAGRAMGRAARERDEAEWPGGLPTVEEIGAVFDKADAKLAADRAKARDLYLSSTSETAFHASQAYDA